MQAAAAASLTTVDGGSFIPLVVQQLNSFIPRPTQATAIPEVLKLGAL